MAYEIHTTQGFKWGCMECDSLADFLPTLYEALVQGYDSITIDRVYGVIRRRVEIRDNASLLGVVSMIEGTQGSSLRAMRARMTLSERDAFLLARLELAQIK